jgi:hypothetical protein
MQLTNIGKNQAMITHKIYHENLNFATDYDVYFSYSQPVVVVDWDNKTVYQNIKKYSSTTSKHTNQFLQMSDRFDDKQILPNWQHLFVNEAKINELSSCSC